MFAFSIKLPEHIQQKLKRLYQRYSIPRWMVFAIDNLAVFFMFWFAYLLRFNFVVEDFSPVIALYQSIIAFGMYVIFSLIFRSYSGLIRHTTVTDLFILFMATTCSFTVLFGLSLIGRILHWNQVLIIPFSILIIHYVVINVILFFLRISIKIFYYAITSSVDKKKKVLIYGAGATGIIAKRVIQSDVKSDYQISGFLDDGKRLQGKKITGIPVYNPKILDREFLQKNNIESMIFAIKDISSPEKSRIIRSAVDQGLEVLDIPSVDHWLNGQFQISQIRKVKLEDLLGRDPIQLNIKRIGIGLIDKTVLVTGAAGSIGSEIVRQLAKFPIKKLVLVDQAETPVFHLDMEIREKYPDVPVRLYLADVTHSGKMESIMQECMPEIVFHAAAYKHVPLMEENPHESIRINVEGTSIIANLAMKYGVRKFVLISTDKAVNPSNIMGASKRICEMIVQYKSQQEHNRTQFVTTRFGNVLGSNGSVIPLFAKQIERGGPVTVTHPEITRYFMTIPEACQLVLEAGFMGKGGEIFVFDMGEPVKIADLANQMIRLSGLEPGKDIKIEYIGLRPGEKLYEELIADKENTLPTHHPKIKIASSETCLTKELMEIIDEFVQNIYALPKDKLIKFCKKIVPEYTCTNGIEAVGKNDTIESEVHEIDDGDSLNHSVEAIKKFINTNKL
ncbi:MAG: polysaccharide biosynthesis protein [Bacteroidales bacterium]|nr:polysaccharide biosynthesis protein [Bacteroidales bacterium]